MPLHTHIETLILLYIFASTSWAQPSNDFCSGAIRLECGDSITSSFVGATFEDFSQNCYYHYFNSESGTLWYEVVGDGDWYEISAIAGERRLFVEIYTGSCGILTCISSYVTNWPQAFKTEENQIYYVRLVKYRYDQPTFTMKVNCLSSIQNDGCELALELNAGDTVVNNLAFARERDVPDCIPSDYRRGFWYYFYGDGKNYSAGTRSYYPYDRGIQIIEGNCTSCSIRESASGYKSISNYFPTIPDEIYRIYVHNTSDPSSNQDFILFLNAVEIASNDGCENAAEITCGSMIEGDTRAATSDSISTMPNLWYSFLGTGQGVSVESLSSHTTEFRVFEGDPTQLHEINMSAFQSKKFFFGEAGKRYYLMTSTGEEQGTFSYQLTCFDVAPNNFCEDALVLECNTPTLVNYSNITSDSSIFRSCVYGIINKNNLWYQFTATGKIYYFDFVNISSSSRLTMFEDGCAEPKCIMAINHSGGPTPTFYGRQGENYLISLQSAYDNDDVGAEFELKCLEPVSNDNCQNATEIYDGHSYQTDLGYASADTSECGDGQRGVWYHILGDGGVYNLNLMQRTSHISLFTGICGDLLCINSLAAQNANRFSFPTKVGVNYYILLQNEGVPINFEVERIEPAINNECADAQLLTCGEELSGSFKNAYSSDLSTSCNQSADQDLWYKLVGDGKFYSLSIQSLSNDLGISVLKHFTCTNDAPVCVVSNRFGRQGNIYFFAEADVEYKIILETRSSSSASFHLTVDCEEVAINIDCQNSIQLLCGDTIKNYSKNAIKSSLQTSCGEINSELWYSLHGTGKYITIERNDGEIHVFRDSCSQRECLTVDEYFRYGKDRKTRFFAEENTSYFIVLGSFNKDSLSLIVNCISEAANDTRINAEEISCGDTLSSNLNGANPDHEGCTEGYNHSVWYHITGVGQAVEFQLVGESSTERAFRLEIMTDSGGVLMCISSAFLLDDSPESKLTLMLENGHEYLIRVSDAYNSDNLKFDILASCRDPNPMEVCSTAVELFCGSSFEGTFQDHRAVLTKCVSHEITGLWFKFEGNNKLVRLKSQSNESYNAYYLLGGLCNDHICTGRYFNLHHSGNSEGHFFAHQGVTYFLFVAGHRYATADFSVECKDPLPGDVCADAISLDCGDTIRFSPVGMNGYDDTKCPDGFLTKPGVWFKASGEKYTTITLRKSSAGNPIWLKVMANGCDGPCLQVISIFDSITLPLSPESELYFLFGSYYESGINEFDLTIDCRGGAESPCANSLVIQDLTLPDAMHPSGTIQVRRELSARNTLIESGASYLWKAGREISIEPNFEVQKNAILALDIAPCNRPSVSEP